MLIKRFQMCTSGKVLKKQLLDHILIFTIDFFPNQQGRRKLFKIGYSTAYTQLK